MKLKVCTINKASVGVKELPIQFDELIRPDLIQKAVEAIQANRRQPYGAMPKAGKRASAKLSRRRRDYKGSYGKGISRAPRKTLNRRGSQFYWVGAYAPGTVGGRKAHPPKADKILAKKINKKERRKAIRSAMAATVVREVVAKRGHIAPQDYPFIVGTAIENIKKTNEAKTALERLGFKDELERVSERTLRSGKGRLRGRRYRQKKGPLVVVSKKCALIASARNIPGLDVIEVQNLNAELLAPGAHIGRLAIYTEGAIDRLANEKLFTNDYTGKTTVKAVTKEAVKKAQQTKTGKTKETEKKEPKKAATEKSKNTGQKKK